MDGPAAAEAEVQAAQVIQAAHRSRSTPHEASPRLASSRTLTAELAISCACDMKPTALGLSWAHARLEASSMRLTGSLAAGLSGFEHLTAVNLSDNRLSSLRGLEALPMLSTLEAHTNRLLGVLDFAAPASGSRLRHANLRNNAITGAVSLPADTAERPVGVDAHTWLEVLLVDHNQIRSLRGIAAVPHLRTFSAISNQLQDTAGIDALTRLTSLDLTANGLTVCHEIGNLVSLRSLRLSLNRLLAMPDLRRLPRLATLELAHNALPSLDDLASAIGSGASPTLGSSPLRSLSLTDNPLVEGCTDLRTRHSP